MSRVIFGGLLGAAIGVSSCLSAGAQDARLAGQHDPLPLVFETNVGQLDAGVDFLARGKGFQLQLSRGGASIHAADSISQPLGLQLVGANDQPIPAGVELLPGRVNYLKGNDPSKWHIGAPLYERARYDEVYPGVDVVYYPNAGELEYDFVVAPNTPTEQIRLRFTGAREVRLTPAGELELVLDGGSMLQHAPILYQEINGQRVHVEGGYLLHADGTIGFQVGAYSAAHTLVIDPVITYSSLFSGSGLDTVSSMTLPGTVGNQPPYYVCGTTAGLTSASNTAIGTGGDLDVFVAKINPFATGAGTLEFLTIVGGTGNDVSAEMGFVFSTVSSLIVSGTTNSNDLPVHNAIDTQLNVDGTDTSKSDALFFALSTDGTQLTLMTYFGGSGNDGVVAMKNAAGTIYLAGETNSTDLPLSANPYRNAIGGSLDTYLARFSFSASGPTTATLTPGYASYLGAGNARPTAMALVDTFKPVIVGFTSGNLGTSGAFQTLFNGGVTSGTDGFVCEFDTAQTGDASLLFNSYLGGSESDIAFGVAVNSGSIYVVGQTASPDFPVLINGFNGGIDGFFARITPPSPPATLNAFLADTTLYGGPGDDGFREVVFLDTNSVFLAGTTNSSSSILLPSPSFDPIQGVLNPGQLGGDDPLSSDTWLVRLSGLLTSPPYPVNYASYLGGRGSDVPRHLMVDNKNRIYLAGQTTSSNFPTSNGFSGKYQAASEGYVSILRNVVFVDPAGSTFVGCGDSWLQACGEMDVAISEAGTYGEIWVKKGDYFDDTVGNLDGIEVYGGFAGDETVRGARNWVANETVFQPVSASLEFSAGTNARYDGLRFTGSVGNNGPLRADARNNTTIANCFFHQNVSLEDGGGVYLNASTNVKILNSVFAINTAQRGGGLAIIDSSATVVNCTFAANSSTDTGSNSVVVDISNGAATKFTNCIMWGDGSGAAHFQSQGSPFASANDCLIQGGYPLGTNILSTDPVFLDDPADSGTLGDMRLADISPARDTGSNTSLAADGFIYADFQNKARQIRGTVCKYDMGAYESDPALPSITLNGNPVETLEALQSYVDLGATADGGCGEDLTPIIDVDDSAVNSSVVGDYTVTFDVVNENGQAASTVTRTVQVRDTQIPTISLSGDPVVQVECGITYNDAGATASDNVDGILTGAIVTVNPVNTAVVASYVVRYNVEDLSGNDAVEVTRTVEVVDTTPPQIVLDGDNPLTVECLAGFTEPGFSVSDDCATIGIADVIISGDTVDPSTPGTYVLRYNVADASGNPAPEVTRTVVVSDTTNPSAFTQDITVQLDASGSVTVDPTQVDNGSIDTCTGVSLALDKTTFTCTDLGANTVTLTVSDVAGNIATQTAVVTVEDGIDPVVATRNFTLQLNSEGTGGITPALVDNGSSDNCSFTLSLDKSGFDCSDVGDNIVTLTATDTAGNTASATAVVTVEDGGLPEVTTKNITVQLDATGKATISATDVDLGSSDFCSAVTLSLDVASLDCSDLGAKTVNLTATDAAGNSASAPAVVTVTDTIPPTVNTQDITVQLGAGGIATIVPAQVDAGSSDNCSLVGRTLSKTSFSCADLGANTVTLTVQDSAGIQRSATAIVTVEDNQLPVALAQSITVQLDASGNASITPAQVDAGSNDGCGAVTLSLDVADFTCAELGANTVTLTATDGSGGSDTATAIVTVQDVTEPVFTLTDPLTTVVLECGESYVEPGVSVSDACDGDLSGSVETTFTFNIKGGVGLLGPGFYTVNYSVSDLSGNQATAERPLQVVDTTAPDIVLNGASDVNLSCGDAYTEEGAVANDVCDDSVIVNIGGDTVNPALPGTYTITYDATDSGGNQATQVVRTVNVLNDSLPVINLIGDGTVVVECGGAYNELGATALDNCVVDLTSSIDITGTVDTANPGTYNVNYSVTDGDGNTASIDRTVEVKDRVAPVVSLIGPATQTVDCGGTYTEQGATALDGCDGTLTDAIAITLQSQSKGVDVTTTGTYVLEYSVSDAAGNTGSVLRTVEVRDTTAPELTLNGAATVTLNCGTNYTELGATATDACEGNLSGNIVIGGDTVDRATPGTYVITYRVQDSAGNVSPLITRSVEVSDLGLPVITLLGPTNVTVDCGATFADPGATASDTCAGTLTTGILRTGTVRFDTPGTYTWTYSVTDPSGNQATPKQRFVTVRNNCTEGAVDGEGEGEGLLEGEGEGVAEGEGGSEGEGVADGEPVGCEAPCVGADDTDEDGDRLNSCEEDFFGTSDADTDSDDDGIADEYEARFCPVLNPTDPSDARRNPDGDGYDNLEEFLRQSDPTDQQSPSQSLFVAPPSAGGEDLPGRGSVGAPFATIAFAISQAQPTPAQQVTILLASGLYNEDFVLKPNMSVLARKGAQPVIAGGIVGADKCSLVDLTIAPRTSGVVLLVADNVAMQIMHCVFRGSSRRDSTGIVITGDRVREVAIESCLFERLAVGIDVDAGHPALRRSAFTNISGAGILIRCDDSETDFSQLEGNDPRTGFNTFDPNLEVPAVINECAQQANMLRNDWGVPEPPTPDSIEGVIVGNVNFDEFLSLGGAVFAGSLFCSVWDAETYAPIENGQVSLQPGSASTVKENVEGVYAFPAIFSGNYTLTIQAPGYDTQTQSVELEDGQLTSISISLRSNGLVEGEGEGEEPPPGGCPCNQNNKLGPPQGGDLMLSMLTFMALALSTFVLRRQGHRVYE